MKSPVQLPEPSKNKGFSIMKSLWDRRSEVAFSPQELSSQELSNLLFAARGINRPEEEKITAPSAYNMQEVSVYAFTSDGVYLYDAVKNQLLQVVEGNFRQLIATSQEWVNDAPIVLLMVGDTSKFEGPRDTARMFVIADAAMAVENVLLFCAGTGLAAHPRVFMDTEALIKLLGLTANHVPVLNVVVGHPAIVE